ncbi:MAG: hypothetical protein AB1586_14475 [Pseudomonadota bacterium]
MAITLQSTVGGFDRGFLQQLPLVEQAMAERGLDPDQIVIAKDRSLCTNAPPFGSRLWDYTVFVGGEHYTVTKPNDLAFLESFYARCLAAGEDTDEPQPAPDTLLSRFMRWMAQPI